MAGENSPEQDVSTPTDDQTESELPVNKTRIEKKTNNSAMIAVVVAILIALALVGLGYAAYQASDADTDLKEEETLQEDDSSAQGSVSEETSPANPEEVEKEIDNIDSAIEELGQEDMDDESFSDESLGL